MSQPLKTYTVADVMAGAGISRDRVYWLAFRDGWHRTRCRPVHYLASDVLETFAGGSAEDSPLVGCLTS